MPDNSSLGLATLFILKQPLRAAALAAALHCGSALADNAVGTVAIVEGHAFAQRGEIYYTRPGVGSEIKVNVFGQYQDRKPEPAYVKWDQTTRRALRPNDRVEEGEIIQTMGDAWVKILFADDSILDIGPAGTVQIQRFASEGGERTAYFKMLYGRIRSIVARAVTGPHKYQLATPTAVMGVRGTEFLVNVFPGKDTATQTEVVCLHGQVSVDVAKMTGKGLVYNQPLVVNPGAAFSTQGIHGLGQLTAVRAVPRETLRTMVARASPHVNVSATVLGAAPRPIRLPGTGVTITYSLREEAKRAKSRQVVSTFDLDHPPQDRTLAAPSGNFATPREFRPEPGGFGGLRDLRRFTGGPPVSLLPVSTARVKVNFNGL